MPDRSGEPRPGRDTTDTEPDEPIHPDQPPDDLWAAQQRAQAITACTLCDDEGYRGHRVCDHTDRTETHRKGIEACRQALKAAQTARQAQPPQTPPKNPPA